jgi:hypothetical protein
VFIVAASAASAKRIRSLLKRLPPLSGKPIYIVTVRGLEDSRGPVYAGSFLRERRIAFNCNRAEFPRVFIHELFHFAWLRLGNPARLAYEQLLAGELGCGASGELGWSAEWRKLALNRRDIDTRTRQWREYCCESFCDTAAWIYSNLPDHEEFTLANRFRLRRRVWFLATMGSAQLSL